MTMRMPWSRIKTIALLLLFTVLAHDAVMAGDPHSASHHSIHTSASNDAPLVHRTGIVPHTSMPVTAPHHGAPVLIAGHEAPCGQVVALRPPAPPDFLPDREATGIIRVLSAAEVTVAEPVRRDDPDHPPDVRRALLQVFLN
jgi:antitoxin (DNA-binding transcriptional repressor) of toxin-antitoxin stability system